MTRPAMQRRFVLSGVALLLAAAACVAGAAGLPRAYAAVVVEPTLAPGRAEFDLSAALARARREDKWLYLYLGASDCPFCRKYEAFLEQNAAELLPHFSKYLIVDLRSQLSIKAQALYLKVGASSLPYTEFQNQLGDERARMLVYPSVWLLDGMLKPLMQMPAGTGTFQTVPEQLEILRLEQ
jgi:thiol-disulfide isomerase/thioredoxin